MHKITSRGGTNILSGLEKAVEILKKLDKTGDDDSLSDAKVIFAGGMGLKNKETF